MKRILVVIMMFWNLLNGNATAPVDWANKARYAQANKELINQGKPVGIVMMGNSITEYWEELHPQFFKDNGLVGRGISGQVSSQMLARFREDVINLNPRVVVINCGTNDIAENNGPYDEDITMDNIMSMTELAIANDITVVLSSVLPCDSFCWNPSVKDVTQKIHALNERISAYAASRGLTYINYHDGMATRNGALNPSYTEDGVHPNSTGYFVMEKILTGAIDGLLP